MNVRKIQYVVTTDMLEELNEGQGETDNTRQSDIVAMKKHSCKKLSAVHEIEGCVQQYKDDDQRHKAQENIKKIKLQLHKWDL